MIVVTTVTLVTVTLVTIGAAATTVPFCGYCAHFGDHGDHGYRRPLQAAGLASLVKPLHPLQAALLASLVALSSAESRTAFEQVPAFVVLDMCYWLKFAAQHRIDDLAVQPLHRTVRALASLLRAGSDALCGGKRLIRSPLVLSEVRL